MRRAAFFRALTSGLAAIFAFLVTGLATLGPAVAQTQPQPQPKPTNCQNTGSFDNWLRDFRREASAQGVTPATLSAVLDDMTLDPVSSGMTATAAFAAHADAATLANVAIAAIEGVRLQHELDPAAARKTRVVAAVTDIVLRELTHGQAVRGKARRARVT